MSEEFTSTFGDYITSETLATLVEELSSPDALIELEMDDYQLTFSIKKS